MVSLHHDPEGEKVFSKSFASSPHATSTEKTEQFHLDNNHTVESLQNKVKELELALANSEAVEPLARERSASKVTFSESYEVAQTQQQSQKNGISMTIVEKGNGVNSTAF